MAAEALEQSMLESKDKDQLLAIAQALGISATARASKATLIGKILETTGVTQASSASADAPAATAAPASGDGAEGAGAPEVVLGPDGEPLSDWELELWKKGQLEQVAPTPAGRAAHRGGGRGADTEGVDGDDHGDDDDGDGDDDGDEGGSGESRNARRRRRRRNKNRGEGDGGPVGPGSQAGQNGQGAQNGQHGQGSGRDRNDRNDRGDRGDRGDRSDRGDRGEPQVDAWSAEPVPVEGHLDLRDEGYGFLRLQGFVTGRDDAYVPVRLVRQLGLRRGDFLVGMCRPAGRNEKNPALVEVSTVNGLDPEAAKERPRFDELTPVHPSVPLRLEGPAGGATADPTGRVIDLVAPIGKGQRGLVVAPPRAGKTTVLKALAAALQQHPEVDLTVVLLDERPEEVTDVRRAVSADVVASTFDRPADEHVHLAELVLEKAKRLAETGRDVVLVVDGITRLTRAYNLVTPTSGRVVAGNLDAAALHPAKRFLGAARALEEGGSLTIIATASAGGNRVDEAILEEIEGTANMVLRLDRRLAERRVVPAIDVEASGTRHADALLGAEEADRAQGLRRRLLAAASTTGADGGSAVEALLTRIAATASNAALLTAAAKEKGA